MSALAAARRQAQLQAQVKYSPQERVLQQALLTAQQTAGQSIGAARGGASALVAAINSARPGLKRGYTDAASVASAARGDLQAHLDSLGPAAAPFSAAVAREQAGTTSRAAQEQANALGELSLRGVSARSGGFAAETNARRQLALDQQSILSQLAGVASDQGAFTASTVGDIQQKNRQLANQLGIANIRSNATLQAAHIRSNASVKAARVRSNATVRAAGVRARRTGARTQQSQARAAAKARATAIGHRQTLTRGVLDQIDLAVGQIQTYGAHLPPHTIRQALTGQVIADQGGTGKKIPIKPIKGFGTISRHDIINAAYDIAVHHYLSPPNLHALRGINIRPEWKPPRANVHRSASSALPF